MLNSVDEVVAAFGGTSAVAYLAEVGLSAVSNWKAAGVIPAEYLWIFKKAAHARGLEINEPAVFRFKDAPAA